MAYQFINAIVQQIQPELTAAEAHGMAAGMLCGNQRTTSNFWLSEVFLVADLDNTDDEVLLANLFEETRRLLDSDDFKFDLFLPTETEASLNGQIAALKDWCQGFLAGFGMTVASADCSPEAREILKDIAECTRLDTDSENDANQDENESAFVEVNEYLRAAVILLKHEFSKLPELTVH